MRVALWALLLLALGFAVLPAQVYYDPFGVSGRPIPGWTEAQGLWKVQADVTGDTWAHQLAAGTGYLLRQTVTAAFGVLEARVQAVSETCAAGLVFHWNGNQQGGLRAYLGTLGGGSVYRVFVLKRPDGASTLTNLASDLHEARIRLAVYGSGARAQVDVGPRPDGKWDYELNLPGVTPGYPPYGLYAYLPYGLYAWNTNRLDDVKFFDAVLLRKSPFQGPTIGKAVPLELYAPTTYAPYVLVPSQHAGMVRLANGWWSPVERDLLAALAPLLPQVFTNFTGRLDASGRATATLNVPNVTALAGTAIYVTGVVLDGARPPRLLHLFNDVRIDLRL